MESVQQSVLLPNYRNEFRDEYLTDFSTDLQLQNTTQPEPSLISHVVNDTLLQKEVITTNKDDEKRKGRVRSPEKWKQNVRKKFKNLGLEYVKANGEVSTKKEMGPPCNCKDKCYLKIGEENCQKVFNNFWKLGDYSLQNAYIAGCVRIVLPKSHTIKNADKSKLSRRYYSRIFYVNTNGVDTEICKQAFLNLHAISNGRLDRLLKKKQECGNTGFDERGRHNNKVNKIPFEKIVEVRKNIDGFRQRAGYYGKRKPKHVEIFTEPSNIRSMYKLYKEEMSAKGSDPVCEYRYRRVFHEDFHIDFAKNSLTPQEPKSCKVEITQKENEINLRQETQLSSIVNSYGASQTYIQSGFSVQYENFCQTI